MAMNKPKALSPAEARQAIDRLIENPATLRLTSHVRGRMRERHFTVDDVLRVLRHGRIGLAPKWDEKTAEWKYTIGYRDLDGDPLTLVIAIADQITVITGHDEGNVLRTSSLFRVR